MAVLVIMTAIGLFLLVRSLDALKAAGGSFPHHPAWQPDVHHFGIAAV